MKKLFSFFMLFGMLAIPFAGVSAAPFNTELIPNGGFESSDTSLWKANGCTLTRDSVNKNKGSYSMKVTNRQNYYSSPQMDITNLLKTSGMGTYSLSASMKLVNAQAAESLYVVISIEHAGQKKWYTGNAAALNSNNFTTSKITKNITWMGELTKASLYVQNVDPTFKSDIYVDDFSLIKTADMAQIDPIEQTLDKRGSDAPTVGAIRWDAWLPKPDSVGSQVAKSLGPNKYHFRLPYFASLYGDNNVDYPKCTQAQLDEEINYAASGGIDYWAYCWYPIGNTMTYARDLHVSSSIRDKVKMCAILNVNPFGANERAQLVGYMKESFYKKVQGGRPLLFFFNNTGSAETILAIRKDCAAQGIPMPYMVSMEGMDAGFDAVSNYAIGGSNGETFSALATRAENNWNNQKNAGCQVLPLVSAGWDPRPRYDNPVSWTTVAQNSWVQTATASEIATHLNNGINWAKNNASSNLANAVLMYAWNEHDEGGWICPTLAVDENGNALKNADFTNKINTDRLDAIRAVISQYKTVTPTSSGGNNPENTAQRGGNTATNAPGTTSLPSSDPASTTTVAPGATDTSSPSNDAESTDTNDIKNEGLPKKANKLLPILLFSGIGIAAAGGTTAFVLYRKKSIK